MPYRRIIVWLLLAMGAGYVVFCGLIAAQKDQMIFPDHGKARAEKRMAPAVAESWWLESEDGAKIEAWWFPCAAAREGKPSPAVIFHHGNGELIDDSQQEADIWNKLGASVLLVEYRGYGRSTGKTTVESVIKDSVSWYDRLAQTSGVDSSKIISHGFSLGGSFAAQLAARRPVAALILESTFTDLPVMARPLGVYLYLARERLDTLKVLEKLSSDIPVLITHGRNDQVINVSHGRRLHAARPSSTYEEEDHPHMPLVIVAGDRTFFYRFLQERCSDMGLALPAATAAH